MSEAHADTRAEVAVIGAGIGGLSAAVRLAAAGADVALIEAQGYPGGKMRTLPSAAGPVDAGPTVLTMKPVFEALFAAAGARLEDHVTLIPQPILARHWWPDGGTLDLFPDTQASAHAIGTGFGAKAAREFLAFDARMAQALAAFEAPMMLSPRPAPMAAARAMATRPGLWPLMAPGRSLAALLKAHFTDPRLRQLFGRYSTYVGGTPTHSPAVLGLIWRAEAAGVWAVQGGMHALAQALAGLFETLGGRLYLNAPVAGLDIASGALTGMRLADGRRVSCRQAVFNGDPAALVAGLMGEDARRAILPAATEPRALSARVWTFAAEATGAPLTHHNLFFADTEAAEFAPLDRGEAPSDPTVYICAQDRKTGPANGPERFQFILNAPALAKGAAPDPAEATACLTQTLTRLSRFGLRFSPEPTAEALTMPQHFAALFPGSRGALYGRSPHGALAPFLRPTARTKVTGLYLAGGGAHPGAGVPMAALSGANAAQAVLLDRTSRSPISRSTSARTAMPGGISTPSATTAPARSR